MIRILVLLTIAVVVALVSLGPPGVWLIIYLTADSSLTKAATSSVMNDAVCGYREESVIVNVVEMLVLYCFASLVLLYILPLLNLSCSYLYCSLFPSFTLIILLMMLVLFVLLLFPRYAAFAFLPMHSIVSIVSLCHQSSCLWALIPCSFFYYHNTIILSEVSSVLIDMTSDVSCR